MWGTFSGCEIFKIPENDKGITPVMVENIEQKENHSSNGNFCRLSHTAAS